MKRILFITSCLALILLTACSKDDSAPSSLTNTSWKYSASNSSEVLKFTSSTAGTYTVTTSGDTKSYTLTYTYSNPNITIKASNGETLDGDFTSSSTLEIINGNSPSAALKFTKQ